MKRYMVKELWIEDEYTFLTNAWTVTISKERAGKWTMPELQFLWSAIALRNHKKATLVPVTE